MGVAPPRLGVVVLNWNGRRHLDRCLRSLASSRPADAFVVVVDNASRDASAELVRAEHPTVALVELAENRRFAGGNNAGAARALELGAEAVVLLNNDTEVGPELLAELARTFATHPRAGIVGARIVYADRPERIWYGGGMVDLRTGVLRHRALRRAVDEGADPEGETDWVTGCALAVRAEVWNELSGLDESFYIYGEDVDLCLRARLAGWEVHYTPRASLRHAVSASVGGHGSTFKAYHKTRSRLQLLARHGRGWWWPASVLLQDLALAFWHLLRGAPGAALGTLQAWTDRSRPSPRHSTRELEGGPLRGDTSAAMMGPRTADRPSSGGEREEHDAR